MFSGVRESLLKNKTQHIYNYNHNVIPKETLEKVLACYQLSIEDVSDKIVEHSDDDDDDLNIKSQVTKFIKSFFKNPYRNEDTVWIKKFTSDNSINIKLKFTALSRLL